MMRSLSALAALLLAAVCTFAAGCSATPAGPSPDKIPCHVLSCNVRYGTANDGDDAWPNRREQLLAAIKAVGAPILGVQEALAFQIEYLEQQLPDHRRLGQGRNGGDRGEFSALFIDERAFEVVEHGDFWLSDTPEVPGSKGWDAVLPRMCTWALLRSRASGAELRVWNTHFDHRGRRARHESARLIARRVAALPGHHVVLGDLNAGETSAPLVALRAVGLRDTFRDIHPDATEVGTSHGFRGGTKGQKIDYVLASAGLETIAAEIASEPGPNGRWPTDHHLVWAALLL